MAGIGERIKAQRLALAWTQDQLAQKAGISKGFLSDLENGKRSVGAENLLDLANALGVSTDFLMIGHMEKPAPSISIPSSLVELATSEGLAFQTVKTLLDMRKQIVAHRSSRKQDNLESVDWRKFYESVKEFLEDGQ